MFFTLQFPIADSRKFIDADTGLLNIPCWPTPITDQDFVRYFGAVRQRRGGGISGWIGESEICEAKRALRIKNQTRVPIGDFALKMNFTVAFRRFYFDGYAVGKFEIGIQVHTKKNLPLDFTPAETAQIIHHLLELPVTIPQPNDPANDIQCPLWRAGRHLADLYRLASTASSFTGRAENWWVASGKPVIVLENRHLDPMVFPYWGKTIPANDLFSESSLEYFLVPYSGINIPLWVLQFEGARKMRDLRVTLLRMHAERECLRKILANIIQKKITVSRGTAASENIQNFLNEAIRRINKFEKTASAEFSGITADFAQYAAQYVSPGADDVILRSLQDIRTNILRKVKDYIKAPQILQEITMGDVYINQGSVGIFGPDGKVQDLQVVQIAGKMGDTLDLNKLTVELSGLKKVMKDQAVTAEQQQSVEAVTGAEKAARNGDKAGALAYLKSAGKWAFDTATKIGIGVITAVIKSELGY